MTILKILGALAAFALGLYAGFGRFRQSQREIDRALVEDRQRRKATRHFTPLDMVGQLTGVSAHRDRHNPFRFQEEAAEDEGAPEAGTDDEDPGPVDDEKEPGARSDELAG